MRLPGSLRRRVTGFCGNECGSVSVEFVLWLPLIAGLLVVMANATLAMQKQTLLFDAARDAARAVATHNATAAEAARAITARLGNDPAIVTSIDTADGFVTASVAVPFSGVEALGSDILSFLTIRASVTMWMEQDDEA